MKFFLVIALAAVSNYCVAQKALQIVNGNVIKVGVYRPPNIISEHSITIPCDYGSADLKFPDTIFDPSKIQIVEADLVFTDHPSFADLKALNTNRLTHLFQKYPSFAVDHIQWKIIRQTNGNTTENSLPLFHGFVIYYRPLQTKEVMKNNISELEKMLTPEDGSIAKKRNGFIAIDTSELRKNYEIEPYTIVLKLPVEEAISYLGIDKKERINYKNHDSVFLYAKPSTDPVEKTIMKPPPDSTVIKVLDRMSWNNMLVVSDVTASMYPYIGQLMLWLKEHEDERRIVRFVFFNDGDNKDDEQKVIGRTGGIYTTASSMFDVVEQLAVKAMSNGSGGNIPENNIEALLAGINSCPECGTIVMIADNTSPVSDMALLKQVTKPVHIIVCGVHDKVNPDYVQIAKSTGGTVQLAEKALFLF